MKEHNTAERIKQMMQVRDLRQVDVLKLAEPYCKRLGVKLGKNDLSQYISGKVEPKQDKLTVLGLALNVSEAWLMGFDVPIERNVTVPTEETGGYDTQICELVKLLNDDQKKLVLHVIRGMLSDSES